jgi:hypothetical protein
MLTRSVLFSRPTRVALGLVVFTRLLVCDFWVDTTRRHYSSRGPSDGVTLIRFDDRLTESPVGLSMFMFADTILFMKKSCRRNDSVDQQE